MDQPIAVMPLHDPEGWMLPHIRRVAPQLRQMFGKVILRVSAATRQARPEWLDWLEDERLFHIARNGHGGLVGEQFRELYSAAAERCAPDQILHLCFPDRVAYALQSQHREPFMADIQAASARDLPLLFQRSSSAWDTHPSNYRTIEGFATQVGEIVLKRSLDLTWCHLVLQNRQLQQVLPNMAQKDLTVLAEIVIHHADRITTKDVDWLAWEDPFLIDRDAASLKREKESSLAETQKRLSYVLPTINLLVESAAT